MNRRGFLGAVVALVAGAALAQVAAEPSPDPEFLEREPYAGAVLFSAIDWARDGSERVGLVAVDRRGRVWSGQCAAFDRWRPDRPAFEKWLDDIGAPQLL